MYIAFAKRTLLADLRSVCVATALLGALAPLAAPAAWASPGAGGEGARATTTATTDPAATAPASGSTGGAAPTPASPGKPTLATWFGPGFYGHATACGQKLTPKLVGVASRTLPCGTLVQIGYRGHRLTVPVLDRGPYGHNGAAWDLTSGAARALDVKETVRITTQIVGTVPNSPTLGEPLASSPLAPGTPAGPPAGPPAAPPAAAGTGGAAAG
jgi:rare lipoprotein A (peptidoglycan hydrolase)